MVGYRDNYLVSDSLEELHQFAKKCAMRPEWFHSENPDKLHYAIFGKRGFGIAKRNGAVHLTEQQLKRCFVQLKDASGPVEARDVFELVDQYSASVRKEIADQLEEMEVPDLIPAKYLPAGWKSAGPKEKAVYCQLVAKYIKARL